MCAITTKPLTMDQATSVIDSFIDAKDWNLATISILLLKATRIDDLLHQIRIKDVFDTNGNINESIQYNEGKTGKPKILPIDGERLITCLTNLYPMICKRDRESNLFFSRKAKGCNINTTITNVTVNRKLQEFVGKFGITAISTHSLRKSSGRAMWKAGLPIEAISRVYNHSSLSTTMVYLAINSRDMDKCYDVVKL